MIKMNKKHDTIMQWDGNIIITPPQWHPMQVEVFEEITGILLGLVTCLRSSQLAADILRIPLRGSAHYGVQFDGEDKFPGLCHAKFVDFRVEDLFFNRGRSRKRCIWTTHNEWMKLVDDRRKAEA